MRRAGPIPTCLCSDPIGPPSATLGTPRTVLHNLSQDTGDLLTSLSFLLYLLIFPMLSTVCIPHVLAYILPQFFRQQYKQLDHSRQYSDKKSSCLPVPSSCNPLLFPLRLHRQLPEFLLIGLGRLLSSDRFTSEPISNLRPLSEITAQERHPIVFATVSFVHGT